jgi:hypothetical protein
MDSNRDIMWKLLIDATIYEKKKESSSTIIYKNLVVSKNNTEIGIFC